LSCTQYFYTAAWLEVIKEKLAGPETVTEESGSTRLSCSKQLLEDVSFICFSGKKMFKVFIPRKNYRKTYDSLCTCYNKKRSNGIRPRTTFSKSLAVTAKCEMLVRLRRSIFVDTEFKASRA